MLSAITRIQRNKRSQEAYGKEPTTVLSHWPLHKHPVHWTGFLSLAPPCSPFPVFSESLPIPVVIAPRVLSQVTNVKRDRHLDSKQLGREGGGEDRRPDISLSLSSEGHSSALSYRLLGTLAAMLSRGSRGYFRQGYVWTVSFFFHC